MIRVSVLYPNQPGARFDADYYLNKHMPRAIERLAPALKGVSVEIGIGGSTPTEPAPFLAVATFTCEAVDAFTTVFMPNAAELQGDIPNYTDVDPVIQIAEICMDRSFDLTPMTHMANALR